MVFMCYATPGMIGATFAATKAFADGQRKFQRVDSKTIARRAGGKGLQVVSITRFNTIPIRAGTSHYDWGRSNIFHMSNTFLSLRCSNLTN